MAKNLFFSPPVLYTKVSINIFFVSVSKNTQFSFRKITYVFLSFIITLFLKKRQNSALQYRGDDLYFSVFLLYSVASKSSMSPSLKTLSSTGPSYLWLGSFSKPRLGALMNRGVLTLQDRKSLFFFFFSISASVRICSYQEEHKAKLRVIPHGTLSNLSPCDCLLVTGCQSAPDVVSWTLHTFVTWICHFCQGRISRQKKKKESHTFLPLSSKKQL